MTEVSSQPGTRWSHPRGIFTVFMVEMWERFAFYGMRALLVLFLVASAADGGLGLSDQAAVAIYGIYTATALLLGLVGGWASDRFLGAQSAVVLGGFLNIFGNLLVGVGAFCGWAPLCLIGLTLDAAGTGFLKPNAGVIVAGLYPQGGASRDAGFTIFYTGINLGAVMGALSVPFLAASFGWWAGFAATSVGMTIGLIQWFWTRHHLNDCGRLHDESSLALDMNVIRNRRILGILVGSVFIAALTIGMLKNPVLLSKLASMMMIIIAGVGFIYLYRKPGLDQQDRRNLVVILILSACVALFLIGYQQGGSSINLFIQRYTERSIFGIEIPAGSFQSIIPGSIVILSPLLAWLWTALGRKGIDPAAAFKFSVALILMGLGFLVMTQAAKVAEVAGSVAATWVIATFLIHTFADLMIYPIGLSAVSKLAAKNLMGITMGLWFVAGAIGNVLAGIVAGMMQLDDSAALSESFFKLCIFGLGTGTLLFVLTPAISKLQARRV